MTALNVGSGRCLVTGYVPSPPGQQHVSCNYEDVGTGGGCCLWLGATGLVTGFLVMPHGAAGAQKQRVCHGVWGAGAVAAWALQKSHLPARRPAPSFLAQTPGLVP